MDKIGFKLNSPNLYYINVKNINNFGIDIKDINIKNIHLVNKPNSFYSLYSTWINSFIVIIVLILIFLVTIINKNIQLKKTSALLKNTLNRFEILLNSSLEGIVIFDDKHRCININEKGCEIFKIKDKDSALGLSLFDYIHPDSLSTIIKNLKINYTKPYEVLLYRIDKSTYPALVQGRNAVFDGEEVRIVSILDISDIKEKEQMLLQHFRLAQMGEMIGMIAHQWRQPLGAITARVANLSLKLMLKKEITPKTLQAELSKINQYSQHLSSTIDDFRNFFKINKKRNKTSFNKIIEKTLLLIEEPLKNKDITIIKELNSDKEFLTYENEITQVILNLIKNAEDILLENRIKNPTITIITIENKIIIKDNGKGVPKDIINKIFDPYFSTKLKKDGTGLGLYMSKTIIEEHCNGKLSVRNEDGIGAVFTIKLDNI
jgi:PAS domain S-box-containing protein